MTVLSRVGGEVLLVLSSISLVVVSLLIPTKVDNRAELANIKLGYPIYFVVQDSSGLSIGEPDSPSFPYPVRFIWENSARLLRNNFLLSIIITYTVLRFLRYFRANLPRAVARFPR